MPGEIDVWLADALGTRVLPLASFDRLSYTRAVNVVGELSIVLPGTFDLSLARPDMLLLVYRDSRLDTETAWIVTGKKRDTDRNGVSAITVSAASGLHLLSRRIVVPGGDDGKKTDNAADVIKQFVRENLGASAAQVRQLPTSLFTVTADDGAGALVTHDGAWSSLLTTCQEIARASAEAGTDLFFDVVWLDGERRWELRTYAGQRGVDKTRDTGAPQTISVETGTVGSETLSEDYADEVTVVYGTGRGDDDDTLETTVEDAQRSGRSIYGRREGHVSSGADDADQLTAEARAELRRGRPRRVYDAEIIATAAAAYGRDWQWGDVLTAQSRGHAFDGRVDAVAIEINNLDGGRETIRARLTVTEEL